MSNAVSESSKVRLSDWSLLESFCRFEEQDNSMRSFFNGGDVSKRMGKIREAITWIRKHWDEYDKFMQELKSSFVENVTVHGEHTTRYGDLFQPRNKKEWADRVQDLRALKETAFLKMYTSEEGYKQIFSVLNGAFRMDSLLDEEVRLRAAVFLVELLTIELFNYTYRPIEKINVGFAGITYRGVSLSEGNLSDFKRLMERPVEERYWSIPLAFMSCTMERKTAVEFAERITTSNPDASYHCVLLRIHVAELDEERMRKYSSRFPSSVVTPICAVDISELSDFPEEREVVLRGPFFQLVGISEEKTETGNTLHILDMLVFNTNRDHPSTMEMDATEGDRARTLFATLIEGARAEKCIELATALGREEDIGSYTGLLENSRVKLADLTK